MEGHICPHCRNPIFDEDALLCHFCGESLQRAGKGFLGRIRYGNNRVLWYFLAFFVLCGFVFFLVK
ncbi:MAG: hypothetical protein HZA29_00215 [Candidatus Omnitrophica bacterium]|nr:hypothetical protein [Candidatus Omnitrophota bacterium]